MGGKVAQLPAEGKGQGAKQKAESRNAEKEDQGTKGLKDQGPRGKSGKQKAEMLKRGERGETAPAPLLFTLRCLALWCLALLKLGSVPVRRRFTGNG
jgi:hypothetical protein